MRMVCTHTHTHTHTHTDYPAVSGWDGWYFDEQFSWLRRAARAVCALLHPHGILFVVFLCQGRDGAGDDGPDC